jgi:small subunit ribosomal protein S21|tara:strand:+ start:2025 stop:2213 length:189 start_codon:yes stop_codon:yes gene_type:complete
MLIVEVKKGNVDRALKIMRRKVKLTKQLLKLRSGKHFTKKSQRKRLQLQKARYRQQYIDEMD